MYWKTAGTLEGPGWQTVLFTDNPAIIEQERAYLGSGYGANAVALINDGKVGRIDMHALPE